MSTLFCDFYLCSLRTLFGRQRFSLFKPSPPRKTVFSYVKFSLPSVCRAEKSLPLCPFPSPLSCPVVLLLNCCLGFFFVCLFYFLNKLINDKVVSLRCLHKSSISCVYSFLCKILKDYDDIYKWLLWLNSVIKSIRIWGKGRILRETLSGSESTVSSIVNIVNQHGTF